jgi:hypothetical protein
MEKTCFGELQCRRVAHNRALRSFVEKHFKLWAQATAGKYDHCKVLLEREGQGHAYHCSIALDGGGRTRLVDQWASTPYQAFVQGLSHLVPG